jgi:hypothetical protein
MLREKNWENYYSSYEKDSEIFTTPKDDARVISDMFFNLQSVTENPPEYLSALVIGVGGSRAIREYSEIFWRGISPQGERDSLTFLDIRDFDTRDRNSTRYSREGKNFLVQADGTTLPFPKNSFNLVLTHCLFECISDREIEEIMTEVGRVSEDGGFGIHTFVDCNDIGAIFRKGFSKLRKKRFGIDFNYRTNREVDDCLNRNGFYIADKGMMGSGIDKCQNLIVGCVKGVSKRKSGFKRMPFVV